MEKLVRVSVWSSCSQLFPSCANYSRCKTPRERALDTVICIFREELKIL